jgi:D-alanyl-D-alanine carboxypeptidase/D-alanyl-D-alanine-endopeptidase (penicillin-binding protein 4)
MHRLRRQLATVLAAAALLATGQASPAHAATPLQDLRARITKALSGSTAQVTGAVVVVEGLGTVYGSSMDSTLRPASTEKLYTAYAAYNQLGPAYRFRTRITARAAPDSAGVVHGDLVLRASGDPTLTNNGLLYLAARLKDAGVKKATGRLVIDDTRYDRRRGAPGWKPEFVGEECGPLSAFVLDRNARRSDAGFLSNPVPANAARLRSVLTKAGIAIAQGTAIGPSTSSVELARHASVPLSDIVKPMLKGSDNFYAEQLLKEVGKVAGTGGTTAAGAAVVVRDVNDLGVGMLKYLDGSGLSYDDRASARLERRFLSAVEVRMGATYLSALPVSCVDGTLENRMCGTSAAGKVRAKTGTLTRVSNLSGYTRTASGRNVRFAILMHEVSSTASARAAQDRAMVAITSFTR